MKKGILYFMLILIISLSALPVSALSASDEPWNSDNTYNILEVDFLIDENDGSVAVTWEEDMATYYDVYLVRLGSDNKYAPVKTAKRVQAGSDLSVTFTADYFTGHQDIDNEYKFCVLAVTEEDGEFYYAYGESFEFEYGEFSGGTVLTVNVTSFLSDTDPITVSARETEMDDAVFTRTVYGNSATCEFDEVHNEDRIIITVSKKDHVTREYEISYFEDTTLDAAIHPQGDLDGDGATTTFDFALANAHAKGVSSITDPYLIQVADIDGDGEVTTFDAALINSHAKGVSFLR